MRPIRPTSVTLKTVEGVNSPFTAMRPDTIDVPPRATTSRWSRKVVRPSSAAPPGPVPAPIAILVSSTASVPRFASSAIAAPAGVRQS